VRVEKTIIAPARIVLEKNVQEDDAMEIFVLLMAEMVNFDAHYPGYRYWFKR